MAVGALVCGAGGVCTFASRPPLGQALGPATAVPARIGHDDQQLPAFQLLAHGSGKGKYAHHCFKLNLHFGIANIFKF